MHIHKKELQNNPIVICIVCFLIGPQDLASLCKPWDRLWTWMLGQHAGCFTTSFYIYIYQAQSSQPSLVYQTVNKSPVLGHDTLVSLVYFQTSQPWSLPTWFVSAARKFTVSLAPFSLLLILSSSGQSHVHMHP